MCQNNMLYHPSCGHPVLIGLVDDEDLQETQCAAAQALGPEYWCAPKDMTHGRLDVSRRYCDMCMIEQAASMKTRGLDPIDFCAAWVVSWSELYRTYSLSVNNVFAQHGVSP